MDVYEVLRLIQLHKSDRAIASALSINRKTVGKYRAWAESQGLLAVRALPSREELHRRLAETWPGALPPQNISSVTPFRAIITELRAQGVEVAAIFQRLQADHHYVGSYSSVWRFVSALEPPRPNVVVRIEVKPGEEAQVDFGYAGQLRDPQTSNLRTAWAFVMTLSFSRHQYVEFVFDQKSPTWLLCHRHAFEYFAGVPERAWSTILRLPSCARPGTIRKSNGATGNAPSTTASSSPRADLAPPSTRARSNRAACTTSSATFWPAVSPPRSRMPTRPCCSGVSRWPGSASTAPSSRNRCCVSAKSSRRPCSRCRRRPTSQAPGSTSSCTVTAMSSSSRPSTRRPTPWSVRASGCAPGRAPLSCTTQPTSGSPFTTGRLR